MTMCFPPDRMDRRGEAADAGDSSGGVADRALTIQNTAQGTLDWSIPTPQLQFAQPVPIAPTVIGKGNVDGRVGQPVLQGKGGPDGFGYRWVDSNEPGGPSFGWVDITGVGTQVALTGDDAWSGAISRRAVRS